MNDIAAHDRREALHHRMRELAGEMARLQGDLLALGPGQRLPGLYLVVEAGGQRALLPASQVQEIVRLVPFSPLPGAPQHAVGSFVCRGQPVLALDLAACLGNRREPDLDAHVVVFSSAPPFGLLVDGVLSTVDAPLLLEGGDAGADVWRQTRLVAGLCRMDDGIVPLLGVAALARSVEGVVP
jgi:purine-binding chemotaxis protein CheW